MEKPRFTIEALLTTNGQHENKGYIVGVQTRCRLGPLLALAKLVPLQRRVRCWHFLTVGDVCFHGS
jgi:hypothetical protein